MRHVELMRQLLLELYFLIRHILCKKLFSLFCSEFENIFDIDWFISSLSKDVTIIKRIPDKIMRSMEKPPYTMRPPRKSTPEYYLDQVLPILLRRRVSGPTN